MQDISDIKRRKNTLTDIQGHPSHCPTDDYDPYDDAALLHPYEHYTRLRERGGVVYLTQYDLYALPQYETVRQALSDWETFSSAEGVMLNDVMNDFMRGTLLCSDPPEHDVKREVIMRPLTPKALREIRDEVREEAVGLVGRLCRQKEFNAATELAQYLPLAIVANRVGLPPVEKSKMLEWAPAAFNCNGPVTKERTTAAFPVLKEIGEFIRDNGKRETVAPGSFLDGLYKAADEGLIDQELCAPMSFDYIAPALDTTISATASAIYLFAKYPDQWEMLKAKPALIPNAINEVVRYESPIQGWTRYVTKDTELNGVHIPKGSRVLVMFGSANRDEEKWGNPGEFDITRNVAGHLGFGMGEHACAGANMARMEISELLKALLDKVDRFELLKEPTMAINNIARVWQNIPVSVHLK